MNRVQLTAIFVLLGEPFDVSTEPCQFHSESIICDEKVVLEKELARMLKPEDLSDHMNWVAKGYELRSEHVIDMLKQFAGGACKALANRDDTEGNMYAGVCAFKDAKQEAFKCDTVDATYEHGNAFNCGGGDFDGACFSLVPSIVWQRFPELRDLTDCTQEPAFLRRLNSTSTPRMPPHSRLGSHRRSWNKAMRATMTRTLSTFLGSRMSRARGG